MHREPILQHSPESKSEKSCSCSTANRQTFRQTLLMIRRRCAAIIARLFLTLKEYERNSAVRGDGFTENRESMNMKKHPQLVEMLPEAILRHGPRRLIDYFAQEKGFDDEHYTDTCSLLQKTGYPAGLRNIEHGSGYQAAFTDVITESLDTVMSHYREQGSDEQLGFIDIGSGKGKALIIAHAYPFKSIVGIEYNRELCEIARKNLSLAGCDRAELFCGDVMEYDGFGGHTVYFAFNPFDELFTNEVVKKVGDAHHTVYFIYNNPCYTDGFGAWKLIDRKEGYCPNRDVNIYYRSSDN